MKPPSCWRTQNTVDRVDIFVITSQRGRKAAFALRRVKGLCMGWSRTAACVNLARPDGEIL